MIFESFTYICIYSNKMNIQISKYLSNIFVSINILSHIIHDLLSSDSCASFTTIPVSISSLQTSVEREMTREIWLLFTFTNGIYHLFVVLTNILSHVIHDLLSSDLCASFETIPVLVSILQTSVTREMSQEMWLSFLFPVTFTVLEKSVIKIQTRDWFQKMRKSLRITNHV